MKSKTLLTLLLVVAAAIPAFAADNAASVLDKAAQKIRTAKSIEASYSLSSPGSGTGTASGTLTLAGDKFVMTSGDMTIWYDGTTQWVYVKADNEVNITEPTADELQQVNPFVIINSFRQNYNAKTLSAAGATKKISLTAKSSKSDIRSATVTISTSTGMPTEISLKMASGQSATIKISSLTTGQHLPVTTFRFPKASYPGAEIVDLR